jgi:hypothetical protein
MVGGRFEFCNPRNAALCPGFQTRTPVPLPDLRPPVAVRWLVLGLLWLVPLGASLGLRRPRARQRLARLGAVAAVPGGIAWTWMWAWGSLGSANDPTWIGLEPACCWRWRRWSAAAQPTRLGAVGWWWWRWDCWWSPIAPLSWFLLDSAGCWHWRLHHLGLTLFGVANLGQPAAGRSHALALAMAAQPGGCRWADGTSRWPAVRPLAWAAAGCCSAWHCGGPGRPRRRLDAGSQSL